MKNVLFRKLQKLVEISPIFMHNTRIVQANPRSRLLLIIAQLHCSKLSNIRDLSRFH